MEIQQLKVLASRIRDLLRIDSAPIGHNKSLDVSAAIVGLRNWPEVSAFPERVAQTSFDLQATARLAYRLKSLTPTEFSPEGLLIALRPEELEGTAAAPQLWPSGPEAGVYLTTDSMAIEALMKSYSDATDGALVYAERAGESFMDCIDLGEGGIWSTGLFRAPSGTLLVLGPLELSQQSWETCAEKIGVACNMVKTAQHRIAVLVKSPCPELVFQDLYVMANSQGNGLATALKGIVTSSGELELRVPFVPEVPAPVLTPTRASTAVIPKNVLPLLKDALAREKAGFVVVGSTVIEDHYAVDLMAACLPLTEHVGPVARILPRTRSTPAKDMLVPDPIKELPMLASIESAYAQGYRRMLVRPGFTENEVLLKYSRDVLFIIGAYGMSVEAVCMELERSRSNQSSSVTTAPLLAALGVGTIHARKDTHQISDLYVKGSFDLTENSTVHEVYDFLKDQRILRWERELEALIAAKVVSVSQVKNSLGNQFALKEFLDQYKARKTSASEPPQKEQTPA